MYDHQLQEVGMARGRIIAVFMTKAKTKSAGAWAGLKQTRKRFIELSADTSRRLPP